MNSIYIFLSETKHCGKEKYQKMRRIEMYSAIEWKRKKSLKIRAFVFPCVHSLSIFICSPCLLRSLTHATIFQSFIFSFWLLTHTLSLFFCSSYVLYLCLCLCFVFYAIWMARLKEHIWIINFVYRFYKLFVNPCDIIWSPFILSKFSTHTHTYHLCDMHAHTVEFAL